MGETRRDFLKTALLGTAGLALGAASEAQEAERTPIPTPKNRIRAHLVYEFGTNEILSAENENVPLNPASLTKLLPAAAFYKYKKEGLMTSSAKEIALAENRLRNALITSDNDDAQYVARFLARQGSVVAQADKVRLAPGTEWTFGEVVVAQLARELTMNETSTHTGSGLPGYDQGVPFGVTTLSDMKKLCDYIYTHHPEIIEICAQPYYTDAKGNKRPNTNRLLESSERRDAIPYRGADGLKTGYIDYSGFNQITSAMRGQRIIAMEIGASSRQQCLENTVMRLDAGFSKLEQKYKPRSQPKPRIDPYAEYAFV